MDNLEVNREHFDERYREVDVERIVRRVRDHQAFLADATATDTSWLGLYGDGFATRLAGRRVLELGAGDGLNALVMSALGAHVVAVDISSGTARIIEAAQAQLAPDRPVEAVTGDLVELALPGGSFDFVVGKSFLHHLTHEQEDRYLAEVARLVADDGEARFSEPAVNSRLLDQVRWLVPVPGRPSRLQRRKFDAWRRDDPHPDRDDSSRHHRAAGARWFEHVEVVPHSGLERLHRLLPEGERNRRFRRFAHRVEARLPGRVAEWAARAQRIVLTRPRR